MFRLLGLIYSPGDMRAAWRALERGTPTEHASAAEYLDNVLTGALRKRVVLMVDDMPIDERVRRTNLLFRTRRRTPEDTLAQLIHDDDQVIAACAIHLAAERGMSSLTDDIEYALGHRDPRDWYVFESASWALAASRMSADDRRARWNEPLPTVELAKRLRGVPVFDYVSVDELFRFAGTARQVRYDRGRTLYDAGLVPNSLQFLIDGEVRLDDGARIVAPGPLAFEELLAGRPVGQRDVCRGRRRHAVADAGRVPHARVRQYRRGARTVPDGVEHAWRRGPERRHARHGARRRPAARRGRPAADGARAAASGEPPDCRRHERAGHAARDDRPGGRR